MYGPTKVIYLYQPMRQVSLITIVRLLIIQMISVLEHIDCILRSVPMGTTLRDIRIQEHSKFILDVS